VPYSIDDVFSLLFATRQVPSFDSLSDGITQISESNVGLDGVVVSSPTFTHESVIREAISNNISVFTEKPVDETAEKIEALFEYSSNFDAELCCGFQRRFDPSYVAAADAVAAGRAGTPTMAHLFFADHPVPERKFLLTGGNIFMDLLAHDADYILHVLGDDDDVISVYATGSSSDEELEAAGVHDNAVVVVKTRRGK